MLHFRIPLPALIGLLLATGAAQAQQITSKRFKTKYQAYTDSLKAVQYDHVFPIWGQKAYARGFDIPYPVGVMTNFLWMDQNILIDNLQLGVTTSTQDVPLTGVDFIEFGDNSNTTYGFNVRPDIWVFPFLNVYGIFGYGASRTEVNVVAPVQLNSIVEQDISTSGFGVMTGFGAGPVWVSVDANWTWNKPELLDKAVNVNVLGLRFGRTFRNERHPERNFAIWAGAMRASMDSETLGAVSLGEAVPQDVWDRRDQIVADYYAWYNDLDPNRPGDAIKIQVADEVLTPIVDRLDNADGSAVVKYGMDKQVKERWNGVVGAQYQFNKHWMLRTEAGLFGNRKSYMLSLNYRFLL